MISLNSIISGDRLHGQEGGLPITPGEQPSPSRCSCHPPPSTTLTTPLLLRPLASSVEDEPSSAYASPVAPPVEASSCCRNNEKAGTPGCRSQQPCLSTPDAPDLGVGRNLYYTQDMYSKSPYMEGDCEGDEEPEGGRANHHHHHHHRSRYHYHHHHQGLPAGPGGATCRKEGGCTHVSSASASSRPLPPPPPYKKKSAVEKIAMDVVAELRDLRREKSRWAEKKRDMEKQMEGVVSELSASRRVEKRALREREEFASLLHIERAQNNRLRHDLASCRETVEELSQEASKESDQRARHRARLEEMGHRMEKLEARIGRDAKAMQKQMGLAASRMEDLATRLSLQRSRVRMYKQALISVVEEKAELETQVAVLRAQVKSRPARKCGSMPTEGLKSTTAAMAAAAARRRKMTTASSRSRSPISRRGPSQKAGGVGAALSSSAINQLLQLNIDDDDDYEDDPQVSGQQRLLICGGNGITEGLSAAAAREEEGKALVPTRTVTGSIRDSQFLLSSSAGPLSSAAQYMTRIREDLESARTHLRSLRENGGGVAYD